MSHNPATHSEISAHPGKHAVTTATSAEAQQADVERKLKFYGVIQAFGDGRMPDNNQINEALNYFEKHSPVELTKLSPDGKLLVEDVRDLLETMRIMVAEKNQGELFQNFVWATSQGDISRGKKSKNELLPVGKDEATAQAKQAAAHLRVLLTLFATNSEARKLLSDLGLVSRDLFATAASKAADKARPDESAMNQVDKSAPDGEFIGEDGRRLGKNETPTLHLKGPGGTELRMNPKDDPADASVRGTDGQTRSAGQAYNEAQEKKEQAKSQAQDAKNQAKSQGQGALNEQGGYEGLKAQAKDHARDVQNSGSPLDTAREKKEQAKGQARATADENTPDDAQEQAKGGLMNKIPEHHKEKARQQIDKGKDFLNENFPQERKDNFIYRLKKVVVECQDHKDYQEAMSFFLDTAENYQGHASTLKSHAKDSASNVADDPAYNQATLMFRALVERFANNQSSQPLIDAIDQMYSDSKNDSELRNWWSRINDYAHRCLLEPGYIMDDECNREGTELQNTGKYFFNDKYKGHFDNFSQQTQTFFTAMGDDPLNQRFGDDWKRLIKDLLFNSEGNLSFKPKLWNDIRKVILPQLIDQIGYVPIPRAEYTDKNIDLVIENLVLQGPNLFPNIINIEAMNAFKFSPYPRINSQMDVSHHIFTLGFQQIQADMRDVQFAFRRKSGWPKISDSGLADVLIGGTGISVLVTLESVENRRDSVFRVKNIKTDIDTLKFSIRDSKHDLLYKFIKATANNIIKKAIEAAVKAAIYSALNNLDDQLAEVRNRMEDAKQSDETTRQQTLKDMFAKKKADAQDKKEKAEEVAARRDSTFKIVLDPKDSVVPDLDQKHTENSWSRRALLVEEAAKANGTQTWKSDGFSLFSSNHPASTGQSHPATGRSGNAGLHTSGKASY